MEKNRIAIVIPYLAYGGAEKMVSLLASNIDKRRFCVAVYCLFGDKRENSIERDIEQSGVTVTYLGKGIGFSLSGIRKMSAALRAFRPDAIHTHLSAPFYCLPWSFSHRVPIIHTVHNIPEKEFSSRLKVGIMRLAYRAKLAIPVAISKENKGQILNYYGLKSDEVECVVNPVHIPALDIYEQSPQRYDFVCVARFSEQKNHALLIDAFRAVCAQKPNASLALVGDGPLREMIERKVKDLNLDGNISFLGIRDDVYDILSESTVFVLSSDYEGLPMTVLESMALGKPVVCTDVGGVSDVVQNGVNGILVHAGDEVALSTAMMSLVSDKALCARMGAESKRLIEGYSIEEVAASYQKIYEKYTQVKEKGR